MNHEVIGTDRSARASFWFVAPLPLALLVAPVGSDIAGSTVIGVAVAGAVYLAMLAVAAVLDMQMRSFRHRAIRQLGAPASARWGWMSGLAASLLVLVSEARHNYGLATLIASGFLVAVTCLQIFVADRPTPR